MSDTPAHNTRLRVRREALLDEDRSSERTVCGEGYEDSYTELEDSSSTIQSTPEESPSMELSPLSTIVSVAKYNAMLDGRTILEEAFPHVAGATPKIIHPEITKNNPCESESSSALEEFRNEWKRELEQSPKHKIDNGNSIGTDQIPKNVEDKAKVFFQSGVDCENAGKLYEAIQFYKRAVQLVPDIDLRVYQHSDDGGSSDEDDEYKPGTDLLMHLLNTSREKIALCAPLTPTNVTHISELPLEIFLYILRWVVSSDLDMRSLEMCSRVSRGFFVCSRDEEIWRIACSRIWGVNCGGVGVSYLSWRSMFIFRPRISFEGCYISKTTYIRHGENSFQDQYYRPWHLVEYFRYLRFFPDGRVLSLITSEEPVQAVGLLKARVPAPRHPPVFVGCYRLVGTTVSVRLRPGPTKPKTNTPTPSTFNLDLEIRSWKKRLHCQLHWRGYSVYNSGVLTPFDLHPARYPPFWFSRVKSYSAETFNPLCK